MDKLCMLKEFPTFMLCDLDTTGRSSPIPESEEADFAFSTA
jgi:hypothetical protein